MQVLTPEDTTTIPNASQGRGEVIATVRSHGGLDDLERLAEGLDTGLVSIPVGR